MQFASKYIMMKAVDSTINDIVKKDVDEDGLWRGLRHPANAWNREIHYLAMQYRLFL